MKLLVKEILGTQWVFEEKCQCKEKLSTEYLEAKEGASNRHPKCKQRKLSDHYVVSFSTIDNSQGLNGKYAQVVVVQYFPL